MQRATHAASQAVLGYFRLGEAMNGAITQKGPDNPLTQADLEVDRILNQHLLRAYPGDGWLSEETADAPGRLTRERVWVVDPIDGTKEFILGIPQFAISMALVEAGRPVVACVHNPALEETFTAVAGGGAFLNGHRLRVSERAQLLGASCLASRSETQRGEWTPFSHEFALTVMGSIAYKLACVAAGRYDLTFTLTPKSEWDICAGELLVLEAGGRMTNQAGQPFRYNQPSPRVRSVLASNGHLHAALQARLQSMPLAPGRPD